MLVPSSFLMSWKHRPWKSCWFPVRFFDTVPACQDVSLNGREAIVKYSDVYELLFQHSNPAGIDDLSRLGIDPEQTLHLSIPTLRKIARQVGINHVLAKQLWAVNIRETRFLAAMIEDPEKTTEFQLERWVKDFDFWEICDHTCINLIAKTKFALKKTFDWSVRTEVFVKRAGFVLMADLAKNNDGMTNEQFLVYFPRIIDAALDDRHYVKKAVSWALRQIGKRNESLQQKALQTALSLKAMNTRSSRMVAAETLRALQNFQFKATANTQPLKQPED